MARFETQLARMGVLMNYKPSINENTTNSPIEYRTLGADGKIYGIIKEGSKYYIKTTTPGKENLVESYDYINGFNYRNENGFNSYNEATKQLEMKMINLNESKGIHVDVSTVDFSRTTKALKNLTLEARKEINRVNQIIENCDKIGTCNTGNPESNGSSSGDNTKKNNKPFDVVAKATLDKDVKSTAKDPKTQGYDLLGGDIQHKLQNADKMERGNRGDEEYEFIVCKDSVASQRPSGAKSVKMNEDIDDLESLLDGFDEDAELPYDANVEIDIELDGDDDDYLLTDNTEDICDGDSCCCNSEFLNSYNRKGSIQPDWETVGDLNESRMDRIADKVINNLMNESTTQLNDWGKHPRYKKPFMTLPDNKEVLAGSADRDWNDESTKGSEPYGKKIGSSAPFVNIANLVKSEINKMIKEGRLKKKVTRAERY